MTGLEANRVSIEHNTTAHDAVADIYDTKHVEIFNEIEQARLTKIVAEITAMTGLIDWSPTRYIPDVKPWMGLKWSQWLDEQYMAMSIATLLGFVWILYRFAYQPPMDASPAAAVVVADAAAAASVNRRKPSRRAGAAGGNSRRRGGGGRRGRGR